MRGPMPNSHALLARLLDSADLAAVVPRLQPEVLHRAIQTWGLEDCAEVLALATPAQIGHLLDSDVWRLRAPGADEELDPDRFGLWISVLMQAGPAVAAAKLMDLDLPLMIAGFSSQLRVFDLAAVSGYTTLDGIEVSGRQMSGELVAEMGGFAIEAKRAAPAWDALVALLAYLEEQHEGYFHRLLRGCVQLSDGPGEEDGFHDVPDDAQEEHLFAVANEREARRERQGYLTPAQAHAFLQGARLFDTTAGSPPENNLARAYFRAIDAEPMGGADPIETISGSGIEPAQSTPRVPGEAVEVLEILREAGVLTPAARLLLTSGDRESSSLSAIRDHIAAYPASSGELAYLANVLMAGASVQGRAFTPREAADAAGALCNLGLESWPEKWRDRDLVTAFQVGWSTLYRDVCLDATRRLIALLPAIHCPDRETRLRLHGLRHELTRGLAAGRPWNARHALDALIVLDARAWAAVLGLIDECPVIHAALTASPGTRRAIDPAAFEFIGSRGQIAVVHEFMSSLPMILAS
jgi:hypothetical protein